MAEVGRINGFVLSCLLLLCTNIVFVSGVVRADATRKSGPFRATLLKTGPCDKPSRPYDKTPTVLFYAEVYNTSNKLNLMRGNLTIVKENRNLMARFKGYYFEEGKWQLVYMIQNVGCTGPVIKMMLSVLGIMYDRHKCGCPKGNYPFSNLDVNMTEHILASKRQYGQLKWKIEVYTKSVVTLCWDSVNLITPA